MAKIDARKRKEAEEAEKAEKARLEAEEKAKIAASRRKRRHLAMLLIAVGVFLIAAGGAVLMKIWERPAQAPEPKKLEFYLPQAELQKLPEVECVLSGGKKVHLAISAESRCDFAQIPKAPLKDAAIMLLSGKTVSDCLYGKEFIKAELAGHLNRAIGIPCIENVYFDDFLLN